MPDALALLEYLALIGKSIVHRPYLLPVLTPGRKSSIIVHVIRFW